MIKLCTIFLFLSCILPAVNAQPESLIRYKDEVFNDIKITRNLSYRDPANLNSKKEYFYYDLYQSKADTTNTDRPLIIWMHGGAFMFDSKNAEGVELWCNGFAKRGYVAAAINYRLSKKNTLFNVKTMMGACAEAVDDAIAAILYFKQNASRLRIDTNAIFLGGNSAGGMIALQTAYSNPSALALLAQDSTIQIKINNPGRIAGVINFWGAIFNIDWLKNASIPIVSVHGRLDNIVPITQKGSMYGSLSIHKEADSLHIVNKIKIYNYYSHELAKDFNPFFASPGNKRRWQEAGQFAADFLYDIYFRNEMSFTPGKRSKGIDWDFLDLP